MVLTIKLKGKKRAMEEIRSGASTPLTSGSEPPHPTKRAKRAEMKQCPVCDEQIPLRLLPKHAELESERVEQIIKSIGSSELPYDEMDDEPGPSSRVRRSAIKARKSMTTRNMLDSLEQSTKTIQNVKRHRKQRGTKLKEMIKEDEEGGLLSSWMRGSTREDISCPVCSTVVRGDPDVLDAHVDACLAHEMQRLEETRQRELQHRRAIEEGIWEGSEDGDSGTYVGNIRGAGFYTRTDDRGVDDEIDIDGDDQVTFGDAQFTEGDIVPINSVQAAVDEDVEVEIMGDNDDEAQLEQMTLRDLIVSGKTAKHPTAGKEEESVKAQTGIAEAEKLDLAILLARERGDKTLLMSALENKLKYMESAPVPSSTPILCRICIDPYTEPTVSTGCWHTCCKECWLRCLGSTKLCPICKRITGAGDLRRVYL
ncbi:hypothetical protein M413DRAFT_441525 [Hebeloma cylindrosporum]|uniref:RING-type domain-containing protein n=1 Tax=Hebeloma cylindrosporum TaxID=76867 RepID=A0A0C2Y9A7_HEBCY|nr:hypothetical protein M413DRAFT_441525 [Hebeloma cylindrosporum h7]